ncbi:MAG: SpoIIE family protein phosphatase [Victivallaceae bacterium]|nr:SpoIIE family protein phosphatase [Victivallaceae bacterium]
MIFLLLLAGAAIATATVLYGLCRRLRAKLRLANERQREIAGFLSRFAGGMREDGGVEGAMHAAARYVAEQTDAGAVAVYAHSGEELRVVGLCGDYPLVHSSNQLIFTKQKHLFEALRREKIESGRGFIGQIALNREPELVADASTDERFADYPSCSRLNSIMAVPLLRDGNLTGVIVAATNRSQSGASFSASQFERLRLLAGQILLVLNLAQVYSEISKRDRIDQELEFARHLQMSLLPSHFPDWRPFAIEAHTRSAKEVNGDFYDFVRIDDDRLLVLVGDACGKGIPACMLTAMTRSFARSLADKFTTLSQFLCDVNDKLHRDTDADRFITLGCCLLDRRHSLIEFGRAGHTDLIGFIHKHIRVFSPDGTALGILPGEFATFDTICFAFQPGSSMMMYSDGLSEATDRRDEEFGQARLSESFRRACDSGIPLRDVVKRVFDDVAAYEAEQHDDQTLLLIRHTDAQNTEN